MSRVFLQKFATSLRVLSYVLESPSDSLVAGTGMLSKRVSRVKRKSRGRKTEGL